MKKFCCVALFLLGKGLVFPQTCPKEPANISRLAEIIDSAKDSAFILGLQLFRNRLQ